MPDQPIDFLRFAENGNLYGFASAHPILRLRQEGVRELPDQPGVYMVFTPAGFTPDFLPKSIARPRKGKPATISVELLRNKHWVPGSRVIYIGKAGGKNNSTIRSRLKQFIDSADGRKAINTHWGGRFIWQLGNINACSFAVLPLPPEHDPAAIEGMLLRKFDAFFNADKIQRRILPFANLKW